MTSSAKNRREDIIQKLPFWEFDRAKEGGRHITRHNQHLNDFLPINKKERDKKKTITNFH